MRDDDVAGSRVGSVLNDKWALEKLLGVGGMGAVYAARHTRNGARAAIKVLHPEFARIQEVRERFLREGRAANSVAHPRAVRVIDDDVVQSGPEEGTAYLVMELLEGASLEDRIETGPELDEREVLEMMDAVLDVLAAAHASGVVHRDLKPENIFFGKDSNGEDAQWMVLDFGLARLIDSTAITERGKTLGTPAYMPPEQAAGRHHEVDGRTDLFALAATAFRVLSGRRVHEAPSPIAVVIAMATTPAPPLLDVAPGVSAATARVIDRGLAFRRDDRYPNAAAMRAEVQQAIAALGGGPKKSIVDVEAPTVASMRAPEILARMRPEPTLELSARDFEPGSVATAPPSIPTGASRVASPPELPGDRRRRARRSFIPVITALFLGGLVVKLALDADSGRRGPEENVGDAGEPSRTVGAPSTGLALAPHDAGIDAADASPIDASALADAKIDASDDGDVEEEEDEEGGVELEELTGIDAAAPKPELGASPLASAQLTEHKLVTAPPSRGTNDGHHATSPGHGGAPGHKPKHPKRPKRPN